MSVWEIAEIPVAAGKEDAFEAGVRAAVPVLMRQPGCREVKLERCIETPDVYILRIVWDSVEDHMEKFRNADDFQEWRRLVGHCFAETPRVRHTRAVI